MVKQSHPPEAPGYNRSSCTRQWLLVAVNSVQVDQKAATRATLTQQAAAQDSRCGQAISPSRAPGYNRSSCTRQWLVDRCQLCSSRPKSHNQGNADSTSRGAGLALWSSILAQQSTRLQQKQLHTPVAFDRCQLWSSRPNQLCSSRPKSRNQGNADTTSRGAGLALWSSSLTEQSTRLQQKQLHTPVAFGRCQLCSSRPKSRKIGQR